MLDRRLALAISEAADIVDAQILKRLVELDPTLCHVDSVQDADQALADGRDAGLQCQVSPLEDRLAAFNDDHRRRTAGAERAYEVSAMLLGPTGFNRLLPFARRENCLAHPRSGN